MTETAEEKLARFETVIGLQMKEIDRLRAENERLRTVAGAHGVLKEIYLNPDAPQGNRIKAAQAALPHEVPRLESVPPPLDLVAEPVEPLADVVARHKALRLQPQSDCARKRPPKRAALSTGTQRFGAQTASS
jgi:hypothetical protein